MKQELDYRVEKVISLMRGNLNRNLSLNQMAQAAHLTPEYFCRVFKAVTGSSPSKYFKSLKMQKAQELLETTALNIKEITALIGIKDVSHFVRDFEAAYGLTPTRYRTYYHQLRDEMSKSITANKG